VRRRVLGVEIGGVPWWLGKHCLFKDDDGATHLGTVVNMYHGEDDMEDDFVVFLLQIKPITTYMGHYCTYSNDSPGTRLVWWNRITWKCKLLQGLGGASGMALPYASCTSNELMEFS